MLLKLFRRQQKTWAASGPPDSRAYAIGDVHGRLDLLTDLLGKIQRDNAGRPPAKTYLIMLGDLVDRGPDSRGVIELFVENPPNWARTVHIMGNHEEYLLDILEGASEAIPLWLAYGGQECIESYGISRGWTLNASLDAIADRLREAVPAAHVAFLKAMNDSFRFNDYLFVHAGIRPGVPVEEQSSKDLRLIREGFLDDQTDHGCVVIHGHTIVDEPEEHANRIALDTGAYRSGCLTAVGLEGRERWFIQSTIEQPDDRRSALGIASAQG